MTEYATKDDVKSIMIEVLNERARVDPATHGEHHEWICARIEAEKARKDMYWSIAKVVAQYSVLGILAYFSGIVERIWHLVSAQ